MKKVSLLHLEKDLLVKIEGGQRLFPSLKFWPTVFFEFVSPAVYLQARAALCLITIYTS